MAVSLTFDLRDMLIPLQLAKLQNTISKGRKRAERLQAANFECWLTINFVMCVQLVKEKLGNNFTSYINQ